MSKSELEPRLIVAAPEQRYDPFPLTDIQQAYWVGRREDIELGGVTCHFYREIDCSDLDLDRLNLAWQRVIARHDMLRVVVSLDGQQRILETVPPYQIDVLDMTADDPEMVNARLKSIREGMSGLVLPLDRWPPFDIRASLLPGRRTRLHVHFEMMAVDARSQDVLFDEWKQFYQDLGVQLEPLEVSFRDFVLAELALRGSEQYREAREYWRSRLRTPSTISPLPDTAYASCGGNSVVGQASLHCQ